MKKKIVAMVTSLVLVAALAVGGTLAWLTDQTEEITNTFTVGNITATLTETFNAKSSADVEKNDVWVGKIVPGDTQVKDPTITIEEGSEACFVYAYIENTVAVDGTIVATPDIDTTKWTPVATADGGKALYRYTDVVTATADVELPVFTKVTYANDIETEDLEDLNGTTIVVQGYAHQSSTEATPAVADAAAKAQFGFTAPTP